MNCKALRSHLMYVLFFGIEGLYFSVLSPPAWSADAPVIKGHLMATPPKIDGIIEAAEWVDVPTGKGAFDNQDGHAAPDPMQFWLAYDANYVYFAARLGDPNPRSIHAQQYQTNVDLTGDDSVQLRLDLNGSLADFDIFGANSRGATSSQLAGGRAAKREWSGEFVAKGRVTETGWEVEARIPWQMMRLPKQGVHNIRFNVLRSVPRDQRYYAYTYNQNGHQSETPVWEGVQVPAQLQDRVLKLLPYIFAGHDPKVGTVFNSGLDMKTELTDKITLVGTINPDFRNIENQILSLDFSRFERLARESRPFFQEGSQFLNSALFESQRINNIDAGVNAYGRVNDKASFGLIDTVRFGHEHDTVVNTSYDPNPNDSYRFTLTSLTRPGLQSTAALARYSRQLGPFWLFFREMASQDTDSGTGLYSTATAFYTKREWTASIEYDRAASNFQARLGLLPEVDYRGPSYTVGYDKVYAKGPIAETSLNYVGAEYVHMNGTQYRRRNEVDTVLALRNRAQMNLNYYTERFNGQNDRLLQAAVTYPRDSLFRFITVEVDSGYLALQRYTSVSSTATFRFSDRLLTSMRLQHVTHGHQEDQLIFSGSYDLKHDRSISARIVKSNSDINGYASFSQSGNRGIEYFLILGDPNSARASGSVIVKAVCPIELLLHRAAIPKAPAANRAPQLPNPSP